MKRQSSITTPSRTSPIEPLPQESSMFDTLTSKIDRTSQAFMFSMMTVTQTDAHLALVRDFNTSNKIWSFSLWS
jgi:hypothetical protein